MLKHSLTLILLFWLSSRSVYAINVPQNDHIQHVEQDHELARDSFDWETYSQYNADLPEEIRSSRKSSWEHYVRHGRGELRLAAPLRIVLKYTVQQGFSNQLYCHISALTLAARLKAEIVLAPAQMRNSFEHYELLTGAGWQPTEWTDVPLNHIIDVQKLHEFWAREGVMLHEVRFHLVRLL